MTDYDLLTRFYTAFAAGDAEGMAACYHDRVVFEDPAFGRLTGQDAKDMWRMLLSAGQPEVEFEVLGNAVRADTVEWTAKYTFGPDQRPVVNRVTGRFTTSENRIIAHRDSFDLWAWSRQALGTPGYLLGWSDFMRRKIQATTGARLAAFTAKAR